MGAKAELLTGPQGADGLDPFSPGVNALGLEKEPCHKIQRIRVRVGECWRKYNSLPCH